MIKLNYISLADKFGPAEEHWKIDNDIDIDLTRCDSYAVVTIWYTTGDITDQIYHKTKILEYFSDLKLNGISCYSVKVPLGKLDKFLHYIEKTDRTQLKEGKKY